MTAPPAIDAVRAVLADMGADAELEWRDDGYLWLRLRDTSLIAVWIEGNEHGGLATEAQFRALRRTAGPLFGIDVGDRLATGSTGDRQDPRPRLAVRP